MANVSGRIIFDRDRSVTLSAGDSGLAGVPVVLQHITSDERLTVLTDSSGYFTFLHVPNGQYRLVEAYGEPGGVPTPGDFDDAEEGSIPIGRNPPISYANNPPPRATHLDSVTPATIFITVSDGDVTGLNFFSGPVIYTPIQAILDPCARISGENLIDAASGGSFGFFPQGTPANTGADPEPYPAVTPDFTYVLPDPTRYTPIGGEYTVQNIMNDALSEQIGAWWRIADHTTGTETGRMMVVNGYNPGAVFFHAEVNVTPNTSYLFTAWILNLFDVIGYPNPELGVHVRNAAGDVLYSATLGTLIPVSTTAPEWKQVGSVINSQNNDSLIIEFSSEGPEVIGNDYAIDDVSLWEIEVPVFRPVKSVNRFSVHLGESVRFTVTLANPCDSPLTNVFFRDAVPDGLTFLPGSVTVNGISRPNANPNEGFSLPDIPGGDEVTVTFEAEATSLPPDSTAINMARMMYDYTPVEGGIPSEYTVDSNEVAVEIISAVPSADISVRKEAHPSPVEAGEIITYAITVSNAGPSFAENVILTDNLPDDVSGAQISTNGGQTWELFDRTFHIGGMEPETSVRLLIRARVSGSAEGNLRNTVTVRSNTPDPNLDNNTDTVLTPVVERPAGQADLEIIKTLQCRIAFPGDMLCYTLTVINHGPDAAQNVLLYDAVPPELTDVAFSINTGDAWCPWHNPYELGELNPGERLVIRLRGRVRQCSCGTIINAAFVTSDTVDPRPHNNLDTVETRIAPGADLSIQKIACAAFAVRGQQLTYRLTVCNHGPAEARHVLIEDDLPSCLASPVFSTDDGRTWQAWPGCYRLDCLAAGCCETLLLCSTVSPQAAGVLRNTAKVSAATPDPELRNNTDTVQLDVKDAERHPQHFRLW